MKASEILPGTPVRLTGDLRLDEDRVAVHDDTGSTLLPVADPRVRAANRLGPVYRRVPGGDPVVPTGRVLVRFADGGDRAAVLAAAGYALIETIGYAPDAVWARAAEGDVVGSLSHLDRLNAAPEVAHAEPELISERAWR